MNDVVPPQVTEAAVQEARGLLNRFLGDAFQEAGAMLGNNIRMFRLRQEIKLLRRAESILKEEGLGPKAVNLRVLLPLIDSAILEDNDDMAERWASLLASAADPNSRLALESSFIEILKQLTPTHALLLDVFYEQIDRHKLPVEEWNECGYHLSEFKAFLKKEIPDFEVAIDNLLRLNLITYPTAKLGIANGREVRTLVTSSDILCATNLGFAFVTACGRGRTYRSTSYGVPGDSIKNIFWTRGGSLHITPSPPAKAIPQGIISPELKTQIEFEALAIAKEIGCVGPAVGLFGRILRVHLGTKELPDNSFFPLSEFCAERALELHIHRTT